MSVESHVEQHGLYIDGGWHPSNSGKTFAVRNPATGEVIARCADGGRAETAQAIDAAYAAFPAWSRLPAEQRAAFLTKATNLMLERAEDLARILTLENGKPLAESIGEVRTAAAFLQWNAEEARRIYGEVVPSARTDTRVLTFKQPVGVVAAITPWNFPCSMVTRKLGPALAAGCTAIMRPARATPLIAIAIYQILHEVGIPKGVVNLVTGTDSAGMGDELATNPKVRKLTFTGSTEVGKQLMAKCTGTVKRVSMELGGHAPFLVFADADLDKAADAVVTIDLRTGQADSLAAAQTSLDGLLALKDQVLAQTGDLADAMYFIAAGEVKVMISAGPVVLKEGDYFGERGLLESQRRNADVVADGYRISKHLLSLWVATVAPALGTQRRIRINCTGRLGGAEIARVEWYREGRVPLHTLRAEIDFGTATAKTTYGTCGVKVWVFKGEIMAHDPMAQDKRAAEQAPQR